MQQITRRFFYLVVTLAIVTLLGINNIFLIQNSNLFVASLADVVGLDSITALPNLPTFNVRAYGALGNGINDDTLAIRAAHAAAKSAGGGIIYLPAGTYAVANQPNDPTYDGAIRPIFNINSSNIIFRGDGPTLSKLVGYMPGLKNPATNWNNFDPTGYFKIGRFTMFRVSTTTNPVSNVQFRSLQVDGQAGWTGNYSVGGIQATGDGWDMTHKGFAMGGSQYLDNILFYDIDAVRWRGEIIYAGGGTGLGKIYIVNSKIRSSNASAVSCGGTILIDHSILGGTSSADYVYNGLENFAFPGQSNTVQDSIIAGAQHNGLVFLGFPNTSATIVRNTFSNNHYGILFSEGGHNVRVANNTFLNNAGSMITSSLGLYPRLGNNLGFDHFTIENNIADRSGSLLTMQEYSSNGSFPYLVVRNNSITNMYLLNGGYGGTPANRANSLWPGFIVDGNTLGVGAVDIGTYSAYTGNFALWTNTSRLPSYVSTEKIDIFNTTNTTATVKPFSDYMWLGSNPATGSFYAVIDPTTLNGYPIGFITKIMAGKNNWVLKADPLWNNFTSNIPIGINGVVIEMMANGKFGIANTITPLPPTCTPNWQCGTWSTCSNLQQTRSCSDTNACGVAAGKPTETQSCTSPTPTPTPTPTSCGNGIIQTGEQCDNGIYNGTCPSLCSTSCSSNNCYDPTPTPTPTPPTSICGDSIVASNEQCDNGGYNSTCPAYCNTSCTINNCSITQPPPPPPTSICGDNVIGGNEQCDNGFYNGPCPALCNTSCTPNSCTVIPTPTPIPVPLPICGNGILRTGEQCDGGSANGYCPATCSINCALNSCSVAPAPTPIPKPLPVCGNGRAETGEQCDNGITNGTCPSRCSLSCSLNSCMYTIVASTTTGGTISPLGTISATRGVSKTFIFSAKTGYYLSSIIVDGVSVKASATYTFRNILANHTIRANYVVNKVKAK